MDCTLINYSDFEFIEMLEKSTISNNPYLKEALLSQLAGMPIDTMTINTAETYALDLDAARSSIASLNIHLSDAKKQLAEAYAKINEMKCCGNCKHYTQMIDQIECEFYCAIEDRLDVTGAVYGNDKCDKWEMK